jgi:hypothetical protein
MLKQNKKGNQTIPYKSVRESTGKRRRRRRRS